MKRWMLVALRAWLWDLKDLLSLSANLVDELCNYSEAWSLGDSYGDDRRRRFVQSGDSDKWFLKIKTQAAWKMSEVKLLLYVNL